MMEQHQVSCDGLTFLAGRDRCCLQRQRREGWCQTDKNTFGCQPVRFLCSVPESCIKSMIEGLFSFDSIIKNPITISLSSPSSSSEGFKTKPWKERRRKRRMKCNNFHRSVQNFPFLPFGGGFAFQEGIREFADPYGSLWIRTNLNFCTDPYGSKLIFF